MTFKYLVLVAGACALLTGCADSSFESGWRSTKTFYSNHINTPAVINYDDKGSLSEAETALARRMRGIEQELYSLERVMANSDRAPSPEVVTSILGRFPWLSGMALLDVNGELRAQQPMPMKSLDFSPLLGLSGRGNDPRGLRGMVQDTPLGAEVSLAIPIYRDAELMALLIAYFDMRALLAYAEEPGDLVVVAPEAVLWSGRFAIEGTPLGTHDWKALTRSNSLGTVSNQNGEFLWMSRFLGTQPLVFAVPTKGQFPEDSNQLAVLGNQRPIVAPVSDFDPMRGGPSLLESPAPHMSMPGSMQESPVRE